MVGFPIAGFSGEKVSRSGSLGWVTICGLLWTRLFGLTFRKPQGKRHLAVVYLQKGRSLPDRKRQLVITQCGTPCSMAGVRFC